MRLPAVAIAAALPAASYRALRLRFGARPSSCREMLKSRWDANFLRKTVRKRCIRMCLKVGHHGSKNSTMPEFLAAVWPRFGIISAGEDNPYGHPARSSLND
jgi:hypothetical protein